MFKLNVSALSLKKPVSLHLSCFNLLLASWLGLALNYRFYATLYALTPYNALKTIGFLCSTSVIVIAAYALILQLFSWRNNAKIVAAILIILGGCSAYFVNSLGVMITADQIQNMQQTDVREVLDLCSIPFLMWSLGFVVLPLLLLTRIQLRASTAIQQIKSKLLQILAALGLIVLLLFVFYVDYAAIFREHRELKAMLSPQNTMSAVYKYNKQQTHQKINTIIPYGTDAKIQSKNEASRPKLMVLVVGETARAESFALNGYQRPTNPELSQLQLINFRQVSACGTATAVSVPCMFSGMSRANYDASLAQQREGLLDIAQRAGYHVTWIDNNSGCKGVCNRVGQYQIPQALRQKWCDARGECLDEILVESLKDYLAHLDPKQRQPQLIVLHQMGSHGPAYYKRASKAYQPFQPICSSNAIQGCRLDEVKNAYDNSIVYTDHVLAQIIQQLQQQEHYQTGFWYLSDHGESTGEHGLYLHGAPYAIAPSQQTHVPMLMWFSKAWQANQPAQINCLKQQQSRSLSQDYLFPTLLNLLDVKSQVIDHKNDMLNECSANVAR